MFMFTDIRLTHCQKKFFDNSRSLQPNVEIPRCRPDGKFQEVQCRGEMCYCVDADSGREVRDTEINTLVGEPRCGDAGKTIYNFSHLNSKIGSERLWNYIVCQSETIVLHSVNLSVYKNNYDAHLLSILSFSKGRGPTRCQRMHREALRSLTKNTRVPQCKFDGSFEEIQCHGLSDECWCVDHQGIEIAGTRRIGPLQCAGVGLCKCLLFKC